MQQLKKTKIIISGGGTGGHIFPALAIAESLKKRVKDPNILFIGAKGKMEMEKVPANGYPIEGLWISGLQRKLSMKNLSFPFKLIFSILKARRIIKKFKPEVVIGTGGYASGPTLRVAAGMNIPTLIQEQNSYPGITNKILSRYARKICVAYENMDKYFPEEKIILTGNPVRKDITELEGKREKALKYFNIKNNNPVVLIIGGSQGAKAINEAIHDNIDAFGNDSINLIWQTGRHYINKAQDCIKNKHHKNVLAMEFISKMDLAYSIADVVVSRAGAIAISELCLAKKPAIFVPLPTAAEDHQTKNAMALVDEEAALIVENKNAESELYDTINKLLNNKDLIIRLSENISKFEHKNASDKIAGEVIKLIKS